MAVVWWCHVKSLISWHFLLLSCHAWKPNKIVFGLFRSQTLFLSLSLPSPYSVLSSAHLVSPSSLCICAIQGSNDSYCLPTNWTTEKPLRAELPGLWCWLCYETQREYWLGVFPVKRRNFSEKANGSLSFGLVEEATSFSVSKHSWLLIETWIKVLKLRK